MMFEEKRLFVRGGREGKVIISGSKGLAYANERKQLRGNNDGIRMKRNG